MKKVVFFFFLSVGLMADVIVKMPVNLGMHTICVKGYLYFNSKKGEPTKQVTYHLDGDSKEIPIKCEDVNSSK